MEKNKNIKIYINEAWIKGESCLWSVQNVFNKFEAKAKLSKKRRDFVRKLQDEGLNITFDKKDIDKDTICFVMDEMAVSEEEIPMDEYNKLFEQRIAAGAGENFYYPFSKALEDYFKEPFFPAVFKNVLVNGGDDKFLVENMDQLDIIKHFYENNYSNPTYKEALDCSIFQQYLISPGKHASYLRVLMAESGEVMGANLKYSKKIMGSRNLNGLFDNVFLNPKSEYFIGASKMFNYYSGGGDISFFQPRFSSEKASVLKENGFDANDLKLPSEVVDVCRNIMANCNREVGILCGMDFMLNESDGMWYYLENQAFPAIDEWAQVKGITVPAVHNVNGYLRYLDLDLQARYEALKLSVNKRYEKNDNCKIYTKK